MRMLKFVVVCSLLLPSFAIAEEHEALKYGKPDTGYIIDYGTYIMSYDGRLKSARWVAEKLTKKSLEKKVDRKDEFRPDRRIPSEFRSELSDYKGSGLDRGHLACSADHLGSREINSATFFLTNMSPQVGVGFNRGYWRFLEQAIRKRALDPGIEELFVFTGPLFMPVDAPPQGQANGTYAESLVSEEDDDYNETESDKPLTVTYRLIGNDHVPVATHYFKAILEVPKDKERSVKVYTFVLPNQAIDKDTPLSQFSRSVDFLEHWAGFDLWSELEDGAEQFKEGTNWGPWGVISN